MVNHATTRVHSVKVAPTRDNGVIVKQRVNGVYGPLRDNRVVGDDNVVGVLRLRYEVRHNADKAELRIATEVGTVYVQRREGRHALSDIPGVHYEE